MLRRYVLSGVSWRDGVEAAFGEGMAAGETAKGEPASAKEAEAGEGDVGVLGAGGEIEALRGADGVEDGREDGPVEAVGGADGEGGLGAGHFCWLRLLEKLEA